MDKAEEYRARIADALIMGFQIQRSYEYGTDIRSGWFVSITADEVASLTPSIPIYVGRVAHAYVYRVNKSVLPEICVDYIPGVNVGLILLIRLDDQPEWDEIKSMLGVK